MDEKSAAFKNIVDKITFVNQLPLLHKATGDDDNPTPGYMFTEIVKITFDSGSYCNDLVDFLVNKLAKNSTHVKLKTLRIMKVLVQQGHPEFKQGLRKRATGIKESIKYSGAPDPVHGNVPYVMVRKEAKELSEMLFEEDNNETKVSPPKSASLIAADGMGSTGKAGAMQGFGNTPQTKSSTASDILSSVVNLADKVLDPNKQKPQFSLPQQNFGDYRPAQIDPSSGPQIVDFDTVDTRTPPKRVLPKAHRKGVAGGGWEDDDSTQESPLSSSTSGSATIEKAESSKPEDWSGELNLVKNATSCSNTDRMIPLRAEINTFVKSCFSLNCDKVVEYLCSNLSSSDEVAIMRSLLMLEGLLRTDLVSPDHVRACSCTQLEALSRTSTGSVQSKSNKITKILQKLSKNQSLFENKSKTQRTLSSEISDGQLNIISLQKADDDINDRRQASLRGQSMEISTSTQTPEKNMFDFEEEEFKALRAPFATSGNI